MGIAIDTVDPATKQITPWDGAARNVLTKFRDSFSALDTENWLLGDIAAGDIVQTDGNTVASSYLVISKDPWTTDTSTYLETRASFEMPIEVALGLSLSQRSLGQEFAVELVSTETALTTPSDVAITSLSQATTTLTVTCTTPHGLVPGRRVGIYGAADSRFNYGSLVVASITSPTVFTATAGPGGTIASLTASTTGGYVYARSNMGGAPNGLAMLFENATVTNATVLVRSGAGDVLPTGTVLGNQSATILTTASVQAVNAAYAYAFQPTNEYRFALASDRAQVSNVAVDSTSTSTAVASRSQVIPDIGRRYKLRIRAVNNKGFTVPVAKIISAAKTGTTTATVVFDRPHGLTTNDYLVVYGNRDTTNFANLTTATQVASIVDATTITLVWGSAVTATGYGGYAAKVQGGSLAFNPNTGVIQSAVLASGVLTLTSAASWTGLSIGDYLNVIGCRTAANGSDMGVDGAWKVRNVTGTTLELEALTGTTPPADFGSTNCGGTVLRRTDMRLSYVRVFDYDRLRVEALPRPTNDAAASLPVNVQNPVTATVASATVHGTQADNSSTAPSPVLISGMTNSTAGGPAAATSGRQGQLQADLSRRLVVTHGGVPQSHDFNRITASTSETTLIAAVASIRHEVHAITIANKDTVAHNFDLRDATGGTIRASYVVPAGQTFALAFPGGMPQSAVNTNWTLQMGEAVTTTAPIASTSSYRTTA